MNLFESMFEWMLMGGAFKVVRDARETTARTRVWSLSEGQTLINAMYIVRCATMSRVLWPMRGSNR